MHLCTQYFKKIFYFAIKKVKMLVDSLLIERFWLIEKAIQTILLVKITECIELRIITKLGNVNSQLLVIQRAMY
jgi:hypothetical protein